MSLLDPARAARLVEYHARDAQQPGFMPVVDKMLAQTWKAPLAAGYPGQIQVVVNNLTLKSLLQLAASPDIAESVRGESLLEVAGLKQWMTTRLGKFEEDPNKFTPAPALDLPPGAPIGMPSMDFLGDDVAY
jgi:hypothetical protein